MFVNNHTIVLKSTEFQEIKPEVIKGMSRAYYSFEGSIKNLLLYVGPTFVTFYCSTQDAHVHLPSKDRYLHT